MTPFHACGIVRGDIQWDDPLEYLEACAYIYDHKLSLGIQLDLGPAYITAACNVWRAVKDLPPGDAFNAMVQVIRETREIAKVKLPHTDLHDLAEKKGWKDPL